MGYAPGERITVTTVSPVYGGYALARTEGLGVLFVRGALPGETVSVRLGVRKKDYAFADVVEVLSPSRQRTHPPCEVFGECGGCQLQHAEYPYQLEMKRDILREAFRRIARIDVAPTIASPGAPFGYRFRGQFQTDGDEVGFHAWRSRHLVPVSRCPLMVDAINRAFPSLRGLARIAPVGGIHVATDGERVLAWFPGVRFDPRLAARFEGTLAGADFEDRRWGVESLSLPLDGLSYAVSPRAFFQANWRVNVELVRRVAGIHREDGGGRLLDLYAGAGNFALAASAVSREVVAVEGDPRAFSGLRRNIRENGIANVVPIRARVESYRPEGKFDALVLDPPRPGLSGKAASLVREIRARRIRYISCNPSTMARDVRALSDLYALDSLEMYDFFPNTHHIEALAILTIRR